MAGSKYREGGFTVIELLMVMLILSVITALAGPSMVSVVKSNRVKTEADRVLMTLNLARSEAVRRNTPVTICRSSNGSSCAGAWSDGWIVFSNVDGDNSLDSIDGDELVQVFEGLVAGYSLSTDISGTTLTYYADGSYAGGAGSIRICGPDRETNYAWSVVVSRVGRSRLSQGVGSCS